VARADAKTRILEAALAQADADGWDAVTLRRIAETCGLSMAEVTTQYRDLNAIADAWFACAQAAMLAPLPDGFDDRPAAERLETLLLRWFDALAPHRRATAEMIAAKMWPFHPHHWVPMVFDLSRLVQAWRDAAGLHAGGRRRQIEEIALTALFVATLRDWCRDGDPNFERTRAALNRRLARADAWAARGLVS
jgi:AcrR family transcriptional regulator